MALPIPIIKRLLIQYCCFYYLTRSILDGAGIGRQQEKEQERTPWRHLSLTSSSLVCLLPSWSWPLLLLTVGSKCPFDEVAARCQDMYNDYGDLVSFVAMLLENLVRREPKSQAIQDVSHRVWFSVNLKHILFLHEMTFLFPIQRVHLFIHLLIWYEFLPTS